MCTYVHVCLHVHVACVICVYLIRIDAVPASSRSALFRYVFASAVGKRYFSERISGSNKGNIMEHHRSVQWSENEYITLVHLVQEHESVLRKDLKKGIVAVPRSFEAAKNNAGAPGNSGEGGAVVDVRFVDYC